MLSHKYFNQCYVPATVLVLARVDHFLEWFCPEWSLNVYAAKQPFDTQPKVGYWIDTPNSSLPLGRQQSDLWLPFSDTLYQTSSKRPVRTTNPASRMLVAQKTRRGSVAKDTVPGKQSIRNTTKPAAKGVREPKGFPALHKSQTRFCESTIATMPVLLNFHWKVASLFWG